MRALSGFAGAAFGLAVLPAVFTWGSAAAPPGNAEAPRVASPRPNATASARPDTEGVKFRALGPAIAGGRVPAVAGSDADPRLYYVGGAGGGVFKSADGGTTFVPAWDGPAFGAIGALAVAPSDERTVWAGTGEANPRNDVSYGDGVYVTHDGAKRWTHVGLERTRYIAKILVDPHDSHHAIVAALGDIYRDSAERGVYVTTDGGNHWTKTLYVGPQSGAADLAWNPRRPSTIYAAIWQFRRRPWIATSGGAQDGLYRSRDFGRTWQKVVAHGFPGGTLGRIGVAVAPSDPRRVYAVVQSKEGSIWRSDDDGTTWRRTSSSTIPAQRPFYFSHLAVDPSNAKRVIALSMYLAESKDGGGTWKHLTGSLHPDHHAIWWSADGTRIIEGNDGGVVLSHNGGASWEFAARIPLAQAYHVAFDDRKPYAVCAGFQDNGSWCSTTTARNGTGLLNRDWFMVTWGDGMHAIPDPLDPSLIWTNLEDDVLSMYDTKARQLIDLTPWPRDVFTSTRSFAESPYRFNWNAPLAFSPQDGNVTYFGGNVVFKTTDRGRTWTPISGDLTRNEKEHQLASGGPITLDVSGAEFYDTLLALAPSSKDANVIWAGSDDGLVHLTRDGGAHWSDVTPKSWPKYGRVEAIDASPFDAGTAFLQLDRHDLGDNAPYAFVTDDYGAMWRSISANLPGNAPLHVVRQDPQEANLLYAGTENGLWVSFDRARRWERLRAGLPATPVYDLRVQPSANDLLVATHGRGIFVFDDLAALQRLAPARTPTSPTFFPVREATLWASFPSVSPGDAGSMPSNVFVAPNAPSGAILTFYQSHAAKERPWIEIVDAEGRVVRTLRGRVPFDPHDPPKDPRARWFVGNDAGLNRLTWDGTEDPPARWTGTSFGNAGPTSGPEALPGTYTARLHIDGATYEQQLTLVDDPMSPWKPEQRAERHAFLATLNGWLDRINRVLDAIDLRLKSATPSERAKLLALQHQLTANDLYDEDGTTKPDRVREQVNALMAQLSVSLQPPFAQHIAALDALRPIVTRALRDADAVVPRRNGASWDS